MGLQEDRLAERGSGEGKIAGVVLALIIGIPLVLVLCACTVIAILLFLGPVIGNVFSNIVTTI